MPRSCALFLFALLFSAFVVAQEDPPRSKIETQGEATIDTIPTYVEFALLKKCEGATLAEAVGKALELEPALRKELEARQLTAQSLTFTSPSIPSIQQKEARVAAKVRFNATGFSTGAEGPGEFAALCDTMVEIAGALGCVADGPALGSEDKSAVGEAAISKAIENAYPQARAAAQIMNAQIASVEKIQVLDVLWNQTAAPAELASDIRRLTCMAKVRVTYLLAPGMP